MNLLKKIMLAFGVIAISVPAWGNMPQSPTLQALKGDSQSLLERCIRKRAVQSINLKAPDNTQPDATTHAYTWGTITHENGYTWYYTQTFEERGWYLGASDILLYDNNFNQVSSLRIEIPEGMNVNDIMPVDFLTTDFFDTDITSTELPIFVHAVDNGTQINKVYVYRLDGEMIQEYDSRSMIRYTADNDYERVLLVREENNLMTIDILTPATEGELPAIEHSFEIDQDLLYYNNGPTLNYYTLAGEPYYCVSHFEKPCMDGFDPETFVPIQTPDNYLIIKTYDRNYNCVDSLRISLAPSTPEATYGFASLGMLSYNDVRLGDFTNDNQRNYIITHYDYYAQSDDFVYHFRVYDSQGNLVNTITENATTWFSMSDVEGYEEQMVFLKMNENAEQILEMVDLPSCRVATVFPAVVDGYQISTTLDRYPVGDDYQYVIGLSQAENDENGDAIARIGWYKRDCTVDHYVTFNIGKNAEGFTPYIASYVFNPYLFNTDATREYFYLAMNKRSDGSEVLDKTLYLADENGNVLRTIKPEEGDEIEFSSGDIFDYATGEPKMVLSFYNGEKDAFEVQFYNLPFDTFTSGGDGSPDNPYLITTPGELAQIKTAPAAHYTIANNIDMSQYQMPYIAPDVFAGTIDGQNYFIENIVLGENGLLGNAQQARVQNLQLQSPILIANDKATGVLAHEATDSNVENVHIYDAVISGDSNMMAGVMVGSASNSTFSAVSVLRAYVEEFNSIGGIAAYADNCNINAAVTTGIIQLGKTFGGIAVEADGTITNSHTDWEGTATESAAGIAAVSTANIANCYTQGYYERLSGNSDVYSNVAGIVHNHEEGNIRGCYTAFDNIVATSGINATLQDNYSQNQSGNDAASPNGAYKNINEVDRTFFETLGYAYGNNNDAPWTGDALPILYFENAKQSTPSILHDNSLIHYDGKTIEVADAQRISLFNMQGTMVATSRNITLDVTSLAHGIYIAVAIDAQGNNITRKIVIK